MNEAKFTAQYIKNHKALAHVGIYEVKFVNLEKRKHITYSQVYTHQKNSLWNAKNAVLRYKIRDESFLSASGERKGSEKPGDLIVFAKEQISCPHCSHVFDFKPKGCIVCVFWKPGVTHFYMIDIDIYLQEEKTSKYQYITEARASEIGIRVDIQREVKEIISQKCFICGKESTRLKNHNGDNLCISCVKKEYAKEN